MIIEDIEDKYDLRGRQYSKVTQLWIMQQFDPNSLPTSIFYNKLKENIVHEEDELLECVAITFGYLKRLFTIQQSQQPLEYDYVEEEECDEDDEKASIDKKTTTPGQF